MFFTNPNETSQNQNRTKHSSNSLFFGGEKNFIIIFGLRNKLLMYLLEQET
jgi:hypothetical protein